MAQLRKGLSAPNLQMGTLGLWVTSHPTRTDVDITSRKPLHLRTTVRITAGVQHISCLGRDDGSRSESAVWFTGFQCYCRDFWETSESTILGPRRRTDGQTPLRRLLASSTSRPHAVRIPYSGLTKRPSTREEFTGGVGTIGAGRPNSDIYRTETTRSIPQEAQRP